MDNEIQIQRCAEILGIDKGMAGQLMEASGWNLELAVQLQLGGGQADPQPIPVRRSPKKTKRSRVAASAAASAATSAAAASSISSKRSKSELPRNLSSHDPRYGVNGVDEDGVRAPIAPMKDTLLPTERRGGFRRQTPRHLFDPLRDFQAEMNTFSASSKDSKKRQMLSKMFEPPKDLLYSGTLEEARIAGTGQKKWILVNIQDPKEFASHQLNRDVWSSPMVKDVLRDGFLFWQRLISSEEAVRYRTLYSFPSLPHVAILDPRTGQRVLQLSGAHNAESFLDNVWNFLDQNSLGPKPKASPRKSPSSKKRAIRIDSDSDDDKDSHKPKSKKKIYSDKSPGRPSATTISASSSPTRKPMPNEKLPTNGNAAMTISSGEHKKKTTADHNDLPPEPPKQSKNMITVLRFIFPDSARVQRRFYSKDTLQNVVDFLKHHKYTLEKYEMFVSHTRKILGPTDITSTLEDLGLKADTIHVQEKIEE